MLDNSEYITLQLRYKFIYSMTGLFLGLFCIAGGIILFLNGVSGSTNWTARILGNESKITDAAPGAVLFIIGLFFVIITRYKTVKIENKERYRDCQKEKTTVAETAGHSKKEESDIAMNGNADEEMIERHTIVELYHID